MSGVGRPEVPITEETFDWFAPKNGAVPANR